MDTQKVLALDYGTVRVGCAVSYGTLAEPLCVLKNSETLFDEVNTLIATHKVTHVLVGVSEGMSAERARAFGQELELRVGCTVTYVDETLSTQSARTKLRTTNKVHAVVDHYAAAEFLQEWLDSYDS